MIRYQLTAQRNSRMSHNRIIRSTMPVRLARRNVHYISHKQLPRRLSFGANKSRSNRDRQDLAALVRVPECACAGSEANIVSHAVICREDRVHVHRSCKGFGGLLGGSVRFVGGADQLHFEMVCTCYSWNMVFEKMVF